MFLLKLLSEILREQDNCVNILRLFFRRNEAAIHEQALGSHLPTQLNPATKSQC